MLWNRAIHVNEQWPALPKHKLAGIITAALSLSPEISRIENSWYIKNIMNKNVKFKCILPSGGIRHIKELEHAILVQKC